MNSSQQAPLFDEPELPHGLVYLREFITPAQEAVIIESIAPLPFREARFQRYLARRRVVHYHPEAETERYDKGDDETFSSGPLPLFLVTLQQAVAARLGIDATQFVHALVTEYRPGTPIGWHRDKPLYGVVVGLSLAGWGRMRFRPMYPKAAKDATMLLELAPRSLYMMRGAIRWEWQHSLLPTKTLRYSITFRTRA